MFRFSKLAQLTIDTLKLEGKSAKHLALISIALVLFGCASAPIYKAAAVQSPANHSSNSTQLNVSEKISIDDKVKLNDLRMKLNSSSSTNEIESLKNQISELEKRISAFENQSAQTTEARTSTGSKNAASPVHIGPRGGCYRISKNGKKYYVKC